MKEKIKIPIENVDEIMDKLNSGVIPKQLEFFKGVVNIKFEKTVLSLGIDEKWQEFLNYLQSEECHELMKKNKITIHADASNLFFDNRNTNESIYDFFFSSARPK